MRFARVHAGVSESEVRTDSWKIAIFEMKISTAIYRFVNIAQLDAIKTDFHFYWLSLGAVGSTSVLVDHRECVLSLSLSFSIFLSQLDLSFA